MMNDELGLAILLIAATGYSLFRTALSWRRREFSIAVTYGLSRLASSFYALADLPERGSVFYFSLPSPEAGAHGGGEA